MKTVKFTDPKYVGDPLNAVRIFNEKGVDELAVVDIDATRFGREPNYEVIAKLANECCMPLSYGGGITSVEQIDRIIGLGVEKVTLSAAVVEDPDLISRAAEHVGSQSIVGVIDVKKRGLLRKYEVMTHNGSIGTGLNPTAFAQKIVAKGVGEIIVNNIDRDGTMQGYDEVLIRQIRDAVSVPLTVLGGAGSLEDISRLYDAHGIIGAAAGSLFVFKGKYRAVLINYPNFEEKEALLHRP